MIRHCTSCASTLGSLLLLSSAFAQEPEGYETLVAGFTRPPDSARPDAFWPWLNGHVDHGRMTEEMEALRAAGFARLQVWDVRAHQDPEGVVPTGPAFLSDEWLANLAHAEREARRLGLELGLVAASGWDAGGDWVEPERALVGLYASAQTVAGPGAIDVQLSFPEVPAHAPRREDGRPAYWRTVAVQAVPQGELHSAFDVLDLSGEVDARGRLQWNAPGGEWVVRWFVYANTGQRLIVPSPLSDGLQIDFFGAGDSEAYFEHVLDRLESALGPLAESALVYLEVDSLELEGGRLTAWTEDVLDVFEARFGYDARPWITLLVEPERADTLGERFLHDWTRLVSDLMVERHYRTSQRVLAERGLYLAAEAGGPGPPIWHSCPVDALGALGAVGLMRGEFWPKQRSMFNVKQIASAAHTYGHTVVDAEAFTSWRHWRNLPYYLKLTADQAFLDGLNHVTFHTVPHRGVERGEPGYAYHAGTHMGPGRVWWPFAGPFIEYLSRCSFMLQMGQPVADVAFYQSDGAPAFHPLGVDWDAELRDAGYDYDLMDVRVLTQDLEVRDGRLVLPHGVEYSLLVLPDEEAIDIEALRKIRQLVEAGARVLGPRPQRSSGLADDAARDAEVRAIAQELWPPTDGIGADASIEKRTGDGGVIGQASPVRALREHLDLRPDFSWEGGDLRTRLRHVHRRMNELDVYFVVNENERWESVEALFRVDAKRAEVWNPATGQISRSGAFGWRPPYTSVALELPPGGSVFVLLRPGERPPSEVGVAPIVRSRGGGPDVAHGSTPNGPAWLSTGEAAPENEFIVFDLGAELELGHADVWNYEHPTRGLLTRGIREADLSVSLDGEEFEPLLRAELWAVPSIGERGYEQRLDLEGARARFVRLDVVSNHSTDWSGHTDIVGLGRIAFFDVEGEALSGVTVREVSSGIAHDPTTDELRADLGSGHPLPGPWHVRFEEGRGAPSEITVLELRSFSDFEDDRIRYFSGLARYSCTFELPDDEPIAATRLDLGRLAGVARVILNGEDLGLLWTPPYSLDVSDVLRPGGNELVCEVRGTWHNRLVGDSALPPEERVTRTNIRRSFTPETPLVESGLLGPVRLIQ